MGVVKLISNSLRMVLLLLVGVLGSGYAGAAVVYVDGTAGGAANGTSWGDAYTTITAGLSGGASGGDELWVVQGTYNEAITLESGVGVYGGFVGSETTLGQRDYESNLTIIDATGFNVSAVMMISVVGTYLDGFTIRGGDAVDGGGIYALTSDDTNTVENCTIVGNMASNFGAGVCLYSASPTFLNCVISGNTGSTFGGGVSFVLTLSSDFINCTISGNSSSQGGGIYTTNYASPTLSNCIISGNDASFGGAGYSTLSSPTFNNCTIAGNTANSGGGLYLFSLATPTVTNTIFYDNSNHAIWEKVIETDVTLVNCLFYGNPDGDYYDFDTTTTLTGAVNINTLAEATDTVDGDPLFVAGVSGNWDAGAVYNATANTTLLTDSTATFVAGTLFGQHINVETGQQLQAVIVSNTATTVRVVGDFSSIVTVDDNSYAFIDYHLQEGSAAIDVGTATNAPLDDFEGDLRDDGFIDIGADEFVPDTTGNVWLDFGWVGTESGTLAEPYSDLDTALANILTGNTIYFNGGSATTSSAWLNTIDADVTLDTYGGSVRIGE